MLEILTITGPIYLVILIGFLTVKLKLFAATDMRLIGRFVLYLSLPALLFRALSTRSFSEIFLPGYMLAYLIGSLLMVAVGYGLSRAALGQKPATAAMSTMGMACPNSGFVGYPIALLAWPDFAGIGLGLNMLVENIIIIPLLLALAESGSRGGDPWQRVVGQVLGRLVTNPLILALAAGVAMSFAPFELPQVASRTISLFADTAGPLSLFVIGGTLAGLPAGRQIGRAAWVIFGKLILHPLAVLAGLSLVLLSGLFTIGLTEQKALIVTGALPIMGIYTILAQKYGEEDLSAVALVGTTVLSFVTLSGLLWALGV